MKVNSRLCIAQAVSRQLPTTAAWVRSCGICGGQSDTWAGFLHTSVSPAKRSTDCSTFIIILGWYNRPELASLTVDLVPVHPTPPKGSGGRLIRKVSVNCKKKKKCSWAENSCQSDVVYFIAWVYDLFLFVESMLTGNIYFDMLKNFVFP
jgi:hypothetical protein